MNPAWEQAQKEYDESVKRVKEGLRNKECAIYIYDRDGLWLELIGKNKASRVSDNEYGSIYFRVAPEATKLDISILADEKIRQLLPDSVSFETLNPLSPYSRPPRTWSADFNFVVKLAGKTLPDTHKILKSDSKTRLAWVGQKDLEEMRYSAEQRDGIFDNYVYLHDFLYIFQKRIDRN